MEALPTSIFAATRVATHLAYDRNATSRVQIIQVGQALPRYFEKVTLPCERILFYSALKTSLDV